MEETYTDIDDNVLSLLSIPKTVVPIITFVRTSNRTYLGFNICCKTLKDNFVILEEINSSLHLHIPWFSNAYITGGMNLKLCNL